MKKQHLKSLALKKKTISTFSEIKGGAVRVTQNIHTICTDTNRTNCHRK